MKTRCLLTHLARLIPVLVLLAGILPSMNAHAAQVPQVDPAMPLAELLRPDGSLDLSTGFSGALDPSGWQMEFAADGAPFFVPASEPASASPAASIWHALGSGLNNRVLAVVVNGSDVYVGGDFTDAGGNPDADHIARWDGTSWHSLGSGLNHIVLAIAVSGPDVYVGGVFTDAGGNPNADYIARWDGTEWNSLGSGLDDAAYSIVVSGSVIYVGGRFTSAGGNPNTKGIARWDGTSWNALGTGLNDRVEVIRVTGDVVYAGGWFTNAGGNPNADYVAYWDGAAWNSLGGGLSGPVFALAVSGSVTYVGGMFNNAGGNPNADHIARWDGTAWNSLGSGLNDNAHAITLSGSDVYVGGAFTDAGGNPNADHIARWDGAAWNSLGSGLGAVVHDIAVDGSSVYVGGTFVDAGGNARADRIARWGEPACEPGITVTSSADSGANTLRQAIADLCPDGTIDFDLATPVTITLTSGQLVIDKNLTLIGPGAEELTISGNHASRVFTTTTGIDVAISGLTVADGYASSGYGGGIFNAASTLTLANTVLSGNRADYEGGGIFNQGGALTVTDSIFSGNQVAGWFLSPLCGGGGIFNDQGVLMAVNSTFSDNQVECDHAAWGGGGGIYNWSGTVAATNCVFSGNWTDHLGGGILSPNQGALTVTDSVFSGNTADLGGGIFSRMSTLAVGNATFSDNQAFSGGGIFNYAAGVLTVTNATFSGNHADGGYGGGILNTAGSTLNYRNTIVAHSTGGDCYSNSLIGENVNNLVEDGSCNAAFSGDPLLAPLAGTGGNTLTHALLPGSPAIDRGDDAACLPVDQRGVGRVGACDIGAFESRGFALAYAGGGGQFTLINTPFTDPLAVTVSSSYAEPVDGGQVQFVGPASGAGLAPITNTATITGSVARAIVSANDIAGSYAVVASARGASPAVTYILTNTLCLPNITVRSDADSGEGTLRWAITNLCPNGRIDFDLATPATITLTGGQLVISRNMTILGPGAASLTVSGNHASRVLTTTAGVSVSISSLTIADGYAVSGGGIFNNADRLTLDDITFSGNQAEEEGGGILNGAGTLTIADSAFSDNDADSGGGICAVPDTVLILDGTSFSGNQADDEGGGVFSNAAVLMASNSNFSDNGADYGGGIGGTGMLAVTDSTFSGNWADFDGGAIYLPPGATLALTATLLSGNQAGDEGGGIANSSNLSMSRSTLSGNQADDGGGIHNTAGGTLALTHSTVSGNQAGYGGGIANRGALTVSHTTFSNNQVSYEGGGIANSSVLTAANVTLSANSAITGGGIWNNLGTATLTNVTLSGNGAAGDGGGIYNSGTLAYRDTIVADSIAGGDCVNIGTVAQNVNNLVEDGSCSPLYSGDPHLGPLGDYGGDTLTHALIAPSDAIDHGDPATCLPTDQRGYVRSGVCDIGAFEYDGCLSTLTVTSEADSGPGSLRQAIALLCPGSTIDFALTTPATITLTSGQLIISRNLSILGPGAEELTISGNHASRVFNIVSGAVAISGMTIADGYVSGNGGGILNSAGSLTVSDTTLLGNQASSGGGIYNEDVLIVSHAAFFDNQANMGGGIFSNAVLTVTHSTFAGNQAQYGGGVGNYGGMLAVSGTTFSGNTVGWKGGGIYNGQGMLTVTNSTFYENQSGLSGGGINGYMSTLTLTNLTLTGNTATTEGGGICSEQGLLNIRNTVVANSTMGDCVNHAGTIGENINNLVEDGSCNALFRGDPLLAPLTDAGDTLIYALLPGSTAIDNGAPTYCPATDQRGVSRPQGSACDIGAFESRGFTLTYVSGSDQSMRTNAHFRDPLVLTVGSGYAEPVDGGLVQFVGPASGAGLTPITNTATIVSGVASVIVTANEITGTYQVVASTRGALSFITYDLTNTSDRPPVIFLPLIRRTPFWLPSEGQPGALELMSQDRSS